MNTRTPSTDPKRGASDDLEFRVTLPASALPGSTHAEAFTQKNCQQLLGIPPRKFLELLRRPDAPAVRSIGKLRLVEREPMLAFLRAIGATTEKTANVSDGADAVLAEIGVLPAMKPGIRVKHASSR